MNVRRWIPCVLAFAAALAVTLAPRGAEAQVATVSVKSAGDLLTQFRALAGQLDAASSQAALQALDAIEDGGQLKGLDRGKPLAATLDLIPNAQAGGVGLPQFVGYVPITSP